MTYLNKIFSPVLLLDQKKCRNNLERMSKKAEKLNMKLCPHWKTCQSRQVGKWARQYGVNQITVSSLKLAEYMCESQPKWDNIHIAFPFNPRLIGKLNEVASKQSVSIQIVNVEVVKKLQSELKSKIGFMIEIDAGYGRAGIFKDDFQTIQKILKIAEKSQNFNFKGFYVHPGHTYNAKSKQDIKNIEKQSINVLETLKKKYGCVCRMGDTPGCSIMQDFGQIDELSPGNFVFYDIMQWKLGSCKKEDIAVCLAVPIVNIKKETMQILVHGGGVHLAKDFLSHGDGQGKSYGEVVLLNEKGWDTDKNLGYVKTITQQHGVIKASEQLISQLQVGDIIGILPIHSCMTSDCMAGYLGLNGQQIDHAQGQFLKK